MDLFKATLRSIFDLAITIVNRTFNIKYRSTSLKGLAPLQIFKLIARLKRCQTSAITSGCPA